MSDYITSHAMGNKHIHFQSMGRFLLTLVSKDKKTFLLIILYPFIKAVVLSLLTTRLQEQNHQISGDEKQHPERHIIFSLTGKHMIVPFHRR